MEDTGELNLLQFTYFDIGIQVFLDGKLLHTDFPGRDNRPDAFLEDVDTEGIARNPLYITLPDDCAGQELRVVTYGPSWDGYRQPVAPILTGRFSDAVLWTVDAVRYVVAVTILALLALSLLLMFLLGAQEGAAAVEPAAPGGVFPAGHGAGGAVRRGFHRRGVQHRPAPAPLDQAGLYGLFDDFPGHGAERLETLAPAGGDGCPLPCCPWSGWSGRAPVFSLMWRPTQWGWRCWCWRRR